MSFFLFCLCNFKNLNQDAKDQTCHILYRLYRYVGDFALYMNSVKITKGLQIFSKLLAHLINMFFKVLVTLDSRCHYAVILTCHGSLLISGFPKDTGRALCFSPDLISSRSALQEVFLLSIPPLMCHSSLCMCHSLFVQGFCLYPIIIMFNFITSSSILLAVIPINLLPTKSSAPSLIAVSPFTPSTISLLRLF